MSFLVDPFNGKKEIMISTLGGSLTAGDGSTGPKNGWSHKLVDEFFPTKFPFKKFIHSNAGIGGAGSSYNALRFAVDVAPKAPDLVIIESAVNDKSQPIEFSKRNVESIISQCKKLPSKPYVAILGLVVSDCEKIGTGVLEGHREIAKYYDIPFIDLSEFIVNEFNSMTQEQMNHAVETHPLTDWTKAGDEVKRFVAAFGGGDGIHPGNIGYQKWYEEIARQIDKFGDSFFRKPADKKPIYDDTTAMKGMNNIHLNTFEYIEHSSDWKYGESLTTENGTQTEVMCMGTPVIITDKVGAKFNFRFSGNTLTFLSQYGPDFGRFKITVDGDTDHSVTLTQAVPLKLGHTNRRPYWYSFGELSNEWHTAEIENIVNDSNVTKDADGKDIIRQNITSLAYICTNPIAGSNI